MKKGDNTYQMRLKNIKQGYDCYSNKRKFGND